MDIHILTRASLESVLGSPRGLSGKPAVAVRANADKKSSGNAQLDENPIIRDGQEQRKDPRLASSASKFLCDVPGCGKAFPKPLFLELHIRTHTNERPYVCDVNDCERAYTRSWHLQRHKEKSHKELVNDFDGQANPPQCHRCTRDSCEKEYNSRDALKKHVARVHEGREYVGRERPGERLSCSYCGASFAKHSRLKAHLFQHTGKLPFSCPYEGCGKEFLLQSRLRRHEKTHAGYECEKCPGHKYTTWSSLRKHFKENHNVKRCSKCDKTFSRPVHLEAHMETHKEEQLAFVCSYEGCDKSYLEMKNLRTHEKAAHEGLRFECALCAKEFRSKQTLRRHGKKCQETERQRIVKTSADRKPRRDKGIPRKRAAHWLSGWEGTEVDPELSSDEDPNSLQQSDDPDETGVSVVRKVLSELLDVIVERVDSQDLDLESDLEVDENQSSPGLEADMEIQPHLRDEPIDNGSRLSIAVDHCVQNSARQHQNVTAAVVTKDVVERIPPSNSIVDNMVPDDLEEKEGEAEAFKRLEETEAMFSELCNDEIEDSVEEVIEISDSDGNT